MIEFVYNNIKNFNTNYKFFKLYFNYYIQVILKNNINLYFKSF